MSQVLAEQVDRELFVHIKSLDLKTVEQYRKWCLEHHQSVRLDKSPLARKRERQLARDIASRDLCRETARQLAHAQSRTVHHRELRKPINVLIELCDQKLLRADLRTPGMVLACEAVYPQKLHLEGRARPGIFKSLLLAIKQQRACFLDDQVPLNRRITLLCQLCRYSSSWLRPVETWRSRTHNAEKQLASLLRHLLVQYDEMPLFFDKVWLSDSPETREYRQWYLHVGRGQNFKHCQLPIPYTSRMAHWFMQAPEWVSMPQAIRWGQIMALGGAESLASALVGTRIGSEFSQEEFWSTVIRWLIAHPMVARDQVGPIIDYLHHAKFESRQIVRPDGRVETLPPLEPGLTMKGRTPDRLMALVEQWHRGLRLTKAPQLVWSPSGFRPFELLQGDPNRPDAEWRRWTIRELLNSQALIEEGRKMRHCVASYASVCARGYASIWTLEQHTRAGCDKLLTIEVRNGEKLICQIRGRLNRRMREQEQLMIARWAQIAGLTIAKYA